VDRYLAIRLQLRIDTNTDLLAKVQSIVECVVEEMDIIDRKKRMQIAGEVCASLKQSVGGRNLVGAIKSRNSNCYAEWFKWSQLALDIHDKLYAALAIGSCDLVRSLMPSLLRGRRISWFNFRSLSIALDFKNKLLLDTTLQYLSTVASQPTAHGVTLQALVHGAYTAFNISAAIKDAVHRNNREYLQDLLNFHSKYLPYPDKRAHESLLSEAIRNPLFSVELRSNGLALVLDFKPVGTPAVTRQILNLVCDRGTESKI
jgi:hypothetical protein